MDVAQITQRVAVRIPDNEPSLLSEIVRSAKDRIYLRTELDGADAAPDGLDSIIVEVSTAMYRRADMRAEGIETEKVDVMSIKYIDDLLAQYADELARIRRIVRQRTNPTAGVVRFL